MGASHAIPWRRSTRASECDCALCWRRPTCSRRCVRASRPKLSGRKLAFGGHNAVLSWYLAVDSTASITPLQKRHSMTAPPPPDNYSLIVHPQAARVLLLAAEHGWTLPSHHFTEVEDILRETSQQL